MSALSRRAALVAAIALAGAASTAIPVTAAAAKHRAAHRHRHSRGSGAVALSRRPVAASSAWKAYVLDPTSPYVYPNAVTVTGGGSVEHADGLLRGRGGATIHSTGAGSPTLWLDLGLDTGGHVQVSILKTDGTAVNLAYSEAKQYMTSQGDTTSGSLGNDDDPDSRSDTIKASRPTAFTSPGIRGGERWIALSLDGAGTVTIGYVRVQVDSYRPRAADYVGHFLSSDSLLNRVWYDSAYTFNLDSIADPAVHTPLVVVDGAKRDRLVWLGDLALDALTAAYSTDQAPSIVRHSIDMFSCQQYGNPNYGYIAMASDVYVTCPSTPPPPNGPPSSAANTNGLIRYGKLPEYTAWWTIAEAAALLYEGDYARARTLLPVMQRTIDYFHANLDANALFLTSGVEPINWHPFDTAYGEDTHTNATWVMALRQLAWVERQLGDPGRAASYDRQADALAAAMRAHLWDASAGAFVINSGDPTNHAQDGNVEAVLAGVVSGVQAQSALGFVSSHLETPLGPLTGESSDDPYMSQYISPYMSSWELLARFQRHDGARALDLVRREYGYMATHDPASTMWEKLGRDGQPASYSPNQTSLIPSTSVFGVGNTSLAHGWSTGPVAALSAYVLGLQPVSPGWSTWKVDPQPVDLRFAQGQVTTPRGVLASRWQRGTRDRWFRLTVIAPRGTRGEVAVPLLRPVALIARDGRVVWRNSGPVRGVAARRQGDVVLFRQASGEHTYAWAVR